VGCEIINLLFLFSFSLQVTLTLLKLLLSTRTADSADSYFIALKALRIILDIESGFQTNAVSRFDPMFAQLMKEIPYEFEAALIGMLQFCDSQVGISFFGRSGVVLEPLLEASTADFSGKGGVSRSGSLIRGSRNSNARAPGSLSGQKINENLYARGDDDILAMLSDAIDKASIRGPLSPRVSSEEGPSDLPLSPRGTSRSDPDVEDRVQHGSTLGRASVLGASSLLELAAPPSIALTDKEIKEANVNVTKAINGWYSGLGEQNKNASKWMFSSSLVDHARVKRGLSIGMVNDDTQGLGNNQRMKAEIALYLQIFKEVLRLVFHIPHPELVSGSLFIGACLIHSQQDVAREAAITLEKIFTRFPEIRLRYYPLILHKNKFLILFSVSSTDSLIT
jgi:hypothetical protein